jgi:hypothetical protein
MGCQTYRDTLSPSINERGFLVKLSRVAACLAASAALLAPAIIASPASATPRANCVSGAYQDHCIFWGQSYNGSHTGVAEPVANFPVSGSTPYVYLSSGTGRGERIGNNNGSDRNLDTACTAILWYDPNHRGPNIALTRYPQSGYQRAGSALGTLLNNIRSQSWVC